MKKVLRVIGITALGSLFVMYGGLALLKEWLWKD